MIRHQRPEDAFGIYSSERSPEYHFVNIGAEGYAEETLVNFVAGNYYVKVVSGSEMAYSGEKLMEITQAVSRSLVSGPELPEILSIFPGENKVVYSESFIATHVLGNEFLEDAFKIDYKSSNNAYSIIVFDRDQFEDCVTILKAYYNYTKEEVPSIWKNGPYVIRDKYNGIINFYLYDNVLFGFLELSDQDII